MLPSMLYQPAYIKSRMERELSSRLNIPRLLKEIDSKPGLTGAGVIYFDGIDILVIREFEPVCQIKPVNIVIRSAPKGLVSPTQPTTQYLEQQNAPVYNLVRESSSTLLACGAAVLGWAVVLGGAVSAVPTGGTSVAVTILASSAAVASSLQCISGVLRSSALLVNNEGFLEWLDSENWYRKTMIALDLVSLAGATAAAMATIKTLKLLKASGSASALQALKQMPRHERKRLTETIIRGMHPGISNGALKGFIRAGVYPARYSATQISHALKMQLADAIGATLSFGGSALSGVIRHPNQAKDLVFGIAFPVETL